MRVERGGRPAGGDGQGLRGGARRGATTQASAARRDGQAWHAWRLRRGSAGRQPSGPGRAATRHAATTSGGRGSSGAMRRPWAAFAPCRGGSRLLPAQARRQTATMAVGAPVTSLDPHYHQLSPNNAVSGHDLRQAGRRRRAGAQHPRPRDRMARGRRRPSGSSSCAPSVRFHNGNAFTAEDVAFTLQRLPNVPNAPSSFAAYSRPITRIEIVDPLTIRFHTAAPYPLLPLDMTNVRIVDARDACQRDDRGLQFRRARHRHRPLPRGRAPQRRPHRVRAQRRLLGRAPRPSSASTTA